MGRIIDEYMDIKLQQKCVSETIDILWNMAQKYQKIQELIEPLKSLSMDEMSSIEYKILEIIEDGKID